MEDSRKPPTDLEQIEALIQEAEKKIASIQFELDEVLNEGGRGIFNELRDIYTKLEKDLPPQEKQKLCEQEEILRSDPLYAKCSATSMRLWHARHRRDMYMACLKTIKIRDALPAAPLPETSVLETVALLVGDGSAESGSPNSCVPDSTPAWGPNSWWGELFSMKKKQD